MKQTARILSTYAGDTSGVCSALYELGGMCVMHDPSGCNSTYNTHDEPRWYDQDSLVFLSGLTEMDAILGNDDRLIGDTVTAARELQPAFVAIAGSPIPMMVGTDLAAVAGQVEKETGIPAFGLKTNGMHDYTRGASMALAALADRFCTERKKHTGGISVNVLGMTPLDFSVNGSERALCRWLNESGLTVNSVWAMGDGLPALKAAGNADVNLLVSACGVGAATLLKSRFQIPCVTGTPYGGLLQDALKAAILRAAETGEDQSPLPCCVEKADTVILGEGVTTLSLSAALQMETGCSVLAVSATETLPESLRGCCLRKTDEAELEPLLRDAKQIIADPMYQPVCPERARFISLPHEAFSGRIYRSEIKNLIADFDPLRKEVVSK